MSTLRGHDRLMGCLAKSGATISADALLTMQYVMTATAIGRPCHGQTNAVVVPPDTRSPKPAASTANMMVTAVESSLRSGCARICVTVAAATMSSVASGPSSSNEANSITKDGGMIAQSDVRVRCLAAVDVRIVATIRPKNSRILSGGAHSTNRPSATEK